MKVYTIPGRVYAVSSGAGCDVQCAGVTLCTVSAGQQGVFVAPGGEVTVSDEGAFVTGVDKGRVSLGTASGGGSGGGGGGGGGGGTTIDFEKVREVAREVVEGEVYEESEVEVSTNDGTVNAEARYVQLAGRYVPDGVVRKIAVKCRLTASANIATEAMYLGVWEKEEGSDKYVRMGSSTEAVAQVVGERKVWAFEGLRLHGRTVRLAFLREHDGLWPTSWDSQIMGVACAAREGGDTESLYMGRGGAASNYAAAVVFTKVVLTDKYAAAGHVGDEAVHLKEGEREKWNKGASDAGSALTKATAAQNTANAAATGSSLTSHKNDAVAHLTRVEHEGLTGLLSGGGGGGTGKNSVAIGEKAIASGASSIAIGEQTAAVGDSSIVLGARSTANKEFGIAIGSSAIVESSNSIAIGFDAQNTYAATVLIQIGEAGGVLKLYFFGPNSELSTNTESEAGIGYVCGDTKGCIKLSELLTSPFELPTA